MNYLSSVKDIVDLELRSVFSPDLLKRGLLSGYDMLPFDSLFFILKYSRISEIFPHWLLINDILISANIAFK